MEKEKINVLVVGKGGREHALAKAVSDSPSVNKLYIAPGNPGTAALEKAENVAVSENDLDALAAFAKEHVDLTIVGPEVPLANGLVDRFEEDGLVVFAPDRKAAQVESSKDFAKSIMKKYGIPTAAYETFTKLEPAVEYVQEKGAPIVIKEDGLAGGKGVTVARSLDEAMQLLEAAFEKGVDKVVIEEFLDGFEFSLIALVHNDLVVPLAIAQDHKALLENDLGPNTGGMGAYSPVRRISQEDEEKAMKEIMEPMAKAMVKEGVPFTGFLYGGLIKDQEGIKVIEFNCRFGDPEAEVILARLESDFIEAILRVLDNQIPQLAWSDQTAHGVVLASQGYPASSTKDALIEIEPDLEGLLFHMGTREKEGKLYSDGGRVLMLVNLAEDLKSAMEKNYQELEKIHCDALFYRKDIGKKDLES